MNEKDLSEIEGHYEENILWVRCKYCGEVCGVYNPYDHEKCPICGCRDLEWGI